MSSVLFFNKDSFLALLFLTSKPLRSRGTDWQEDWVNPSLVIVCARLLIQHGTVLFLILSHDPYAYASFVFPNIMMLREWLIGASGLLLRTGFYRLKANAVGPRRWRIPLKVQINLKMARHIVEPIAKFKVGFLLISAFKLKYDITVQCLKFRTQRV